MFFLLRGVILGAFYRLLIDIFEIGGDILNNIFWGGGLIDIYLEK